MDKFRKPAARAAGKELDGVTLIYKWDWPCSKCVGDQKDVLHCERGSKVRAVNLDAGWACDQERAHKFLTEGEVYEVESLEVGGWQSIICLKEFPGERFNTVHFERCE